jgi:hypothetical protein
MKWILTRYNHDIDWLKEYTGDWVMYDRSPVKIDDPRIIPVSNVGSDIYDKLKWIIENYENLPDVVLLAKANLIPRFITKEEFDLVKDNKTFTPLLTKNHKTEDGTTFYSEDGMYNELNNAWYLNHYPVKSGKTMNELGELLNFTGLKYLKFAPGANYILPKENILQHPKEFYQLLFSYLGWSGDTTQDEGESQMIERAFYSIFK